MSGRSLRPSTIALVLILLALILLGLAYLFDHLVLSATAPNGVKDDRNRSIAVGAAAPKSRPVALLPGEKLWKGGVSSFLFGSNDTEEWSPDNVETDPHRTIQSSMRGAHFTLERTFIFHYSLRDGHRTTIGTRPRLQLNRRNPHEYDRPTPPPGLYTGPGYEVEKRVNTIENVGMQCLVTFMDIWTTPKHNVDPNPFHKRIIDPDTGKPETDLDFARKVVAYLGNRCNLYEIGNEPEFDVYTASGLTIKYMDVRTYVERWTEFVRALRKINPKAKFIGPVAGSNLAKECTYVAHLPYPSSQPGDCYMQNFLHGVKNTDVVPDAVSFHWYPCNNSTLSNCTSTQWSTYVKVINEVRGWVQHDLGRMVPVGITEWNFDPGNNNALSKNREFMQKYTQAVINAMVSTRLDFANQFDTQSYAGYGALDLFDVDNRDRPKPQFVELKRLIARYRRR